jgi:hypothetical protein
MAIADPYPPSWTMNQIRLRSARLRTIKQERSHTVSPKTSRRSAAAEAKPTSPLLVYVWAYAVHVAKKAPKTTGLEKMGIIDQRAWVYKERGV